MKPLTKLKTIEIISKQFDISHNPDPRIPTCKRLKLFSMYSVEILSNVETIKMIFGMCNDVSIRSFDLEFIKFVPKLRVIYMKPQFKLRYFRQIITPDHSARIVGDLKTVLHGRRNQENSKDFIELIVDDTYFEIFRGIDGIGDPIKLIKWEDDSLNEKFLKFK